MFKNLLKAILVAFFVNSINCEEFKVIEIENGPIKGIQQESIFEKTQFYSFKGIPYAKPPIGDLRFELPKKLERWTETKETLEMGPGCLNFMETESNEKNSEDCLYLNVYTPDLSTSKKLPVMVFIHGETLQGNSFYGADFLMDENVILVTFNYRFGVFGFLSLNSTDLPKNIGLKDQQFVLKWVHENIHYFGGDKKKVTVFGQGTGSSFAHLHSLSHESRKYFEKCILQSGVAIGNWAYGKKGYNHESEIFEFAHKHGEECTNLDECLVFLKKVDASLLVESTKYKLWSTIPGKKLTVLPFRPVIEDADTEHPFITERPEDLMKNKNLNMEMMIGYTTQEFLTTNPETKDSSLLTQFFEKFEFSLPRNDFNFDTNSKVYEEISSKVKKFYFPNGTSLSTDLILQFNDLFSDTVFAYPADRTAKSNSLRGHAKTYYYRFGVDDSLNVAKQASKLIIGGAGHNDEICYIFKCEEMNEIYEKLDPESTAFKTVKIMAKLWADFAKYGNPTKNSQIEWKSFSRQYPNYFYIMNDGVSYELDDSVLASETNRRLQFWDDLFETYDIFAEY